MKVKRIIKLDLEENSVFSKIGKTRLQSGGTMSRRSTSISARKVDSVFYITCLCTKASYLQHADYKEGFGGKFGVQSDRQDKSACGWDHIEKVVKHESQKGGYCRVSVLLSPHFCPSLKIIKRDSEENLEFRRTDLISPQSVGSIMKKLTNTNLRKVKNGEDLTKDYLCNR